MTLGSEPTDGFANGTTVSGLIQEEGGRLFKLILGAWPQACWVGPHFPNRSTNFEPADYTVNCSDGDAAGKRGCLFELSTDPGETRDLGAEPAQQARVSAMLRAVLLERENAFNPHRGRLDPRACEVATGKYRGFWGPFAS